MHAELLNNIGTSDLTLKVRENKMTYYYCRDDVKTVECNNNGVLSKDTWSKIGFQFI